MHSINSTFMIHRGSDCNLLPSFSLFATYYITVMVEVGPGRDPPLFTLVTSTDPLRKKLNQMHRQHHFIDYFIKCDPVEIPCHKVVITPQCEYFDKMLIQEDMAEMAKQSIDLGLLNSDAILLVIGFLYTGSIEVEFAAAKDVLKVVNYLHPTDGTLLEKLSAYVIQHLDANNCLVWFHFSCQMSMTKLKEEACKIMLRSFEDVVQGAEFLDLSFTQLAEYMRCKLDEQDTDHDQGLKAVVRWTMHSVDNRKEHFEELVMMIDLTKCSAHVLKTIYDNHGKVLVTSLSLMQEFTSAALSLAAIEQSKHDIIVTGGLIEFGKYSRKSWRLNLKTGQSVEKASHLTDRFGTAICASPKGIICTGGAPVDNVDAATTDCVLYDVEKDQWVALAPIPVPTFCAGAVCVGESSLMVIGGSSESIKKVWCLDFKTGTWTDYPDLLQGVVLPAVGCIDKSVFVVFPTNAWRKHERRGSEISLQCLKTTTASPSWEFKSPLPDSVTNTDFTQAVTFEGQLYLLGRHDRLCLWYDPTADAWAVLAQSLQPHRGGAALVMNNKIIICGGWDDEVGTDTIEEYDPSTNTWTLLPVKLPVPLFLHGIIHA